MISIQVWPLIQKQFPNASEARLPATWNRLPAKGQLISWPDLAAVISSASSNQPIIAAVTPV
jgi:hypothetical protein